MHGFWRGVIATYEGSSVLVDSKQRAPLKVAKPFPKASGELAICLMDASPGLFNGDVQEIECRVKSGARVTLTSQSACKLHPSLNPEESRLSQRFIVDSGAVFHYDQQPLIPFRGARFLGETEIRLQFGAEAVVQELVAPGRSSSGELFRYERLRTHLSIFWDNVLTAVDPLLLEPNEDIHLSRRLGGYSHIATLWWLSGRANESQLKDLRAMLDEQESLLPVYAGCSMLHHGGLVVRVLSEAMWQAKNTLDRARQVLG